MKEREYVTLIPAGGWRVEWTNPDDGSRWDEPLIGWALTSDGEVYPLSVDSTGLVDTVDGAGNHRVFHPDTKASPAVAST